MSLTQLRSILGKLLHLSYVVPECKLFLNRLLHQLRGLRRNIPITRTMALDFHWIAENLPRLNCHRLLKPPGPRVTALGVKDQSMELPSPQHHGNKNYLPPATLAIMRLHDVIAAQPSTWAGKTITLEATAAIPWSIFISGKSRRWCDLQIARSIWEYTALHNIHIEVLPVPSTHSTHEKQTHL